ncbi:MAG: fumarylacetoacetate hydrolase family protein [Alphaproteobacteria bacterium]|nr:fumarylacetoacetate hydrolase family protein [Alphaproteobacteria bacterium]MDE2163571.1 fumarylacetoacetate hydrolase family protein [Alphaproteobacteria bacterium]MDE2266231.1 fumarylacetoacetate hydrolase family protein [Alphaproteobacteria bacterium]MDE2499480.1 fumarylacetoacetate hydrolase family protein [Alphaproteobacteria bacterium]
MIEHLPQDWRAATLLGRIETSAGPTPILVSGGHARDISAIAPTVSQFLEIWDWSQVRAGVDLGPLETLDLRRAWDGSSGRMRLLAPVDLQCIKAAGVTFAVSAVERVIEERARGEASRAEAIRAALRDRVGTDIRSVKPGSPEAKKLKDALIADGLWSQYLEVAIGPDAEVFTKAPTLSSVGWGDWVGVRSDSVWNNPEPEIVLVCDRAGRTLGAALGNDVNLRCIEGRSALLLGKAKDNNASCSIGPFIRLFDDTFALDDVRKAVVRLEVVGEDGYRLEGKSSMTEISRDPLELVGQTIGKHHQYPDGFALFLGTMFAPTDDRGAPGSGFTHKQGDVVRVSSEKLGVLENKVTCCDAAPPWTFGVGDLMCNLASRGLLKGRATGAEVKL